MKKFELLGKRLPKHQQKLFKGGSEVEPGDDGQICLTCSSDDACARVNKGKCVTSTCNNVTAKYCDMS